MGFSQLEKDVLDKVKKDADKIVLKAKDEADKILIAVKNEAKTEEKQSAEELKRLTDMMHKREIASGKLEAKKSILQAKKEMIEKAFSETRAKLDKMSATERAKLNERLLKKAESQITVGRVYANDKDCKAIGAEARKISGGIIAESKDGLTMVDYSFDTLLADIKDKHIAEITEVLFK